MRGRFWCEHAWLGGEHAADSVRLDVANGRVIAVAPNSPAGDAIRLYGLTLPGFANTHSHVFHRLLRGKTHDGAGDFWTWREAMFRVADSLDPATYLETAERTFTEMLRSGFTVVGEFHYLHNDRGGTRYDDPNAMGRAVFAAARRVGIRLTMLDTLYQHGGLNTYGEHEAAQPEQLRFIERPADWRERIGHLDDATHAMAKLGAAVHSIRAVDAAGIATVVSWADQHRAPLHAHVSEQPTENTQSLAAHGLTPTAVLERSHALGDRFTAVHGTHLSADDIATLGQRGATVCLCPTTERDLADGVGPSRELVEAGAKLALGSDSHAFIDPFEEARAVELNRRLVEGRRGTHSVTDLLSAATANGYAALGWPDGGVIREGGLADFVTVRTTGPRMGGSDREHLLASALFAAHPEDVTSVVAGGVHHEYV